MLPRRTLHDKNSLRERRSLNSCFDDAADFRGCKLAFHALLRREALRQVRQASCMCHPQLPHKNRYQNIVPFDHNVVQLPAEAAGGDYLNASWINISCFQPSHVFPTWIATQAPFQETAYDFFSMFLDLPQDRRPQTIVRLAAAKEADNSRSFEYMPKQEQEGNEDEPRQNVLHFFPSIFDTTSQTMVTFNDPHIKVELKQTSMGKDEHFTKSVIEISRNQEITEITHFDFHNWPDHGVPEEVSPVLELTEAVVAASKEKPVVVHCAAGVGRTGTFIAIATLQKALPAVAENAMKLVLPHPAMQGVDGFGNPGPSLPEGWDTDPVAILVDHLRSQRTCMVQNNDQFEFVVKAAQMISHHYNPQKFMPLSHDTNYFLPPTSTIPDFLLTKLHSNTLSHG